jgi:O-antigen/teichoic acid export membrane protein
MARSLSRGVQASVKVSGGTLVGQGIVLAVMPALTRLYSPDDFAIFGVFGSILLISLTISTGRYDAAIPTVRRNQSAFDLSVVAFGWAAITSVTLLIAAHLLGKRLAEAISIPELEAYWWLLPLAVGTAASYRILVQWAIRFRYYGALGWTRLSQGVGQAVISVALGLLYKSPVGLILGQMAGLSAGIMPIASSLRRQGIGGPSRRRVKRIRATVRRFSDFPLHALPAAVLTEISYQVGMLIMATVHGATAAGLYTLADRVVSRPLALIASATRQVYFGSASALSRSDPSALRAHFWRTARAIAFISAPISLALAGAGPYLTYRVFGPEWSEAGLMISYMAAGMWSRSFTVPLYPIFQVLRENQWELRVEGIRVAVMMIALPVSLWMSLSPIQSIGLIILATIISDIIFLSVVWHILRALPPSCR